MLERMRAFGGPLVETEAWRSTNALHRREELGELTLYIEDTVNTALHFLRIGADTISFHDPRSQAGVIRPPVAALTTANTDQVVVRVKEGMLLVFPSCLQHSVELNLSTQPRVSISFNIMFADFTQTMSKPLWGRE